MFNYYREMRELKRTALQYQVILLGKLYDVVQMFDNGSDIMELAKKLKDVDQKDLVEQIVKNITVAKNETVGE